MFVYEEDAIPADVCGLNVKVIRLSRSHRYNDAAAATDFWASLEDFLLQPRKLCLAFDRRLDASGAGDSRTKVAGVPGSEAYSEGGGSTRGRSFGTGYGGHTMDTQRGHPGREGRYGYAGQREQSLHQLCKASSRHGQC
ncbi:rna polymerase ii accessory factor cdc73 [Cystoisospora suis]|uniref:Rna polymerase ii accessory factor cdc73 n=1 Tax=Cystoisospora suis TaxID=483139 RepID=A0A2C6JZW5_9APIC|nr:rna polymerase ii accessory factor cdc73 [Cystoisospora suis]